MQRSWGQNLACVKNRNEANENITEWERLRAAGDEGCVGICVWGAENRKARISKLYLRF